MWRRVDYHKFNKSTQTATQVVDVVVAVCQERDLARTRVIQARISRIFFISGTNNFSVSTIQFFSISSLALGYFKPDVSISWNLFQKCQELLDLWIDNIDDILCKCDQIQSRNIKITISSSLAWKKKFFISICFS